MSDKDSWWKDASKNSGGSTTNPFEPRTTQNDGSSFSPRSVNEGFELRVETFEKKNRNNKHNPE